jgi:site-specific recombinase XerD
MGGMTMKPTDFSYHLSNYLSKYLPSVAGLSSNTILSYRDTFSAIVKYFDEKLRIKPEKLTIAVFNETNVTKFLDWIEQERKNSVSTRNVRLAAIHVFARYVARHSLENMRVMQEILSIPIKKAPSRVPDFLSVEALKLMLSLPDKATKTGRRDCVLLSLMYDTGARVQEICDIVASDVRLDAPSALRLTGKGMKTRSVPLMPSMVALLKQYLKENALLSPETSGRHLFTNHCGGKFTRKGITYVLNKYFQNAKALRPDLYPKSFSPHGMRHSKAMHLLQSDVNLIYIRDILGHVDIKTTERYARIDAETKRKVLETASIGVSSDIPPIWQSDSGLLAWLKSLG